MTAQRFAPRQLFLSADAQVVAANAIVGELASFGELQRRFASR